MTTTITNIHVTTKGKTPGNVDVSVAADITNAGGNTPTCTFPAQSEGMPMTHKSGNTWEVSDTQTYDGGEQTVTVSCNGVSSPCGFKP